MPYILSLSLNRFEYDWERDARIKLDDEVTLRPWDSGAPETVSGAQENIFYTGSLQPYAKYHIWGNTI